MGALVLWLSAACSIAGAAGIPDGYRQVWEMAGRGETEAALPLLLKIIEQEPTFVPAYRTLGQIFARRRDEAGLMQVLSRMDQRFTVIARAEYHNLLRYTVPAQLYKDCSKHPDATPACFALADFVDRSEALRMLQAPTASLPKGPAACIALIHLRAIGYQYDVGRIDGEACVEKAEASGDLQFRLWAADALAGIVSLQVDPSPASALQERVAQLAEESGDYDHAFFLELARYRLLWRLGRHRESESNFQRLRDQVRSTGNDFHFMRLTDSEVSMNAIRGLPERAEESHTKSIEVHRRLGLDEPDSYGRWIAGAYARAGDLPNARRLLPSSGDQLRGEEVFLNQAYGFVQIGRGVQALNCVDDAEVASAEFGRGEVAELAGGDPLEEGILGQGSGARMRTPHDLPVQWQVGQDFDRKFPQRLAHVPLGDGIAQTAAPPAAGRLKAHEFDQFARGFDVPSVSHKYPFVQETGGLSHPGGFA